MTNASTLIDGLDMKRIGKVVGITFQAETQRAAQKFEELMDLVFLQMAEEPSPLQEMVEYYKEQSPFRSWVAKHKTPSGVF